MKKITMLTFYTVDDNESGSVEHKARTEVYLNEASLPTAFEMHQEKIGAIERKIIKDQADLISKENA